MVLGWVVWVTVFGLKGGLFGWEGVGELFATHAYFKLNLQEQKNNVAEDRKAQSGAADFVESGGGNGDFHGSDKNKSNQAVEDRYRKVGSGVLINTESPNKGKPGSTTKVWTDGNATSIKEKP